MVYSESSLLICAQIRQFVPRSPSWVLVSCITSNIAHKVHDPSAIDKIARAEVLYQDLEDTSASFRHECILISIKNSDSSLKDRYIFRFLLGSTFDLLTSFFLIWFVSDL